jgi:biotin transport system substrate-specific component
MSSLVEALPRPRARSARLATDATIVVAGGLLIAWLAQISIKLPFTPVPITGQTLGVLLIGTSLGWLRGGLALALYLAEIAIGLPFAAEGEGGIARLTLSTPSGGFLWGFLAASLLMGLLANQGWDRSLRSSISVMLLGTVVIYIFGLPWLYVSPTFEGFLGHQPSVQDTLVAGLYPFVVGDLLKLMAAACALPLAWRLLDRRQDA